MNGGIGKMRELVLVAACAIWVGGAVHAATVTVSATANNLNTTLSQGIVGPASVTFTYDDATSDADGSPGTGSYLGAISDLSFSLPTLNYTVEASTGDITVTPSGGAGFVDLSVAPGDLSAPLLDSIYRITGFSGLSFDGGSGTAPNLTDDTLPGVDFSQRVLQLTLDFEFIRNANLTGSVIATFFPDDITRQITVSPPPSGTGGGVGIIPVPAALPLMLTGLAGLIGFGRSRRRNA